MAGMGARAVLAVLAFFVALAGCSADPTTPPENPPAAVTGTELTATAVSAQRWASEVAELRSGFDEAQAGWDGATCSALAVPDAPDCQARLLVMALTAQTAQITLDGLQNVDGPAYLGAPPDEISELVADTVSAAQAASTSGQVVACPGAECVSTASAFTRDWDKLGSAYSGWDPYS